MRCLRSCYSECLGVCMRSGSWHWHSLIISEAVNHNGPNEDGEANLSPLFTFKHNVSIVRRCLKTVELGEVNDIPLTHSMAFHWGYETRANTGCLSFGFLSLICLSVPLLMVSGAAAASLGSYWLRNSCEWREIVYVCTPGYSCYVIEKQQLMVPQWPQHADVQYVGQVWPEDFAAYHLLFHFLPCQLFSAVVSMITANNR